MDENPDFEALLQFLRDSRGFDFTGYKRASLTRRVSHRMQRVGIEDYADYQDYLQVHQDEFTELFNTILINVTGFFRDPEVWRHLRTEVLPELVSSRKPTDRIRVWSAGCASGEEAYTAAILLADLLGAEDFLNRVKIYATDVDEEALAHARAATYQAGDLKDVPEEWRENYFERNGQRYVFRKDLRRAIIFGRNDLVQDAPISRIDLLTCRNTLMYFNAETQARVVSRFHFALNDDGILFLGKAEMLLAHTPLFTPIDMKRRIFKKVAPPMPAYRALALPREPYELMLGSPNDAQLQTETLITSPIATIAVAANGELGFVNHRAEVLFGLTQRDLGRPFRDLEVSYRPVELRSYIDQALAEKRSVWIRDVSSGHAAGDQYAFEVQAAPLIAADGSELGCAIYFHDVTRYRRLQQDYDQTNKQLETAYEELQSTVEELETTNEELQSTVEELETTNEELQSTNEELETMNEELQSTNDELQTINDELRQRTDEVDEVNAFSDAILTSLHQAVVVVDRDLLVRTWNRRAEDLWGLRPDEVWGQHLMNLDIGLPVESLRAPVRTVLAGTEPEAEVHVDAVNRRGRACKVRVRVNPLQRGEERTGAVLVMEEIDVD